MEQMTLLELNGYIRQVMALNFPDPLWVSAEIVQCKESRGHFYLDLIEKSETDQKVLAKAGANLWRSQFLRLSIKHGPQFLEMLRVGIEVLLKVRVEFHEQHGLKLVIEDIDPAYTIGKLEMHRQAIVNALAEKKLLDLNGSIPLPPVLQHVAILSNETAAGYQDFLNQCKQNKHGYQFSMHLFPIALQGEKVEGEVLKQLEIISQNKDAFDCVAIIRGGGSKLDLMGFDNELIGETIARLPLPVLTGIGHEIDETIADLVAHTRLKTPTAVAEFLIHHNFNFESNILNLGQNIHFLGRKVLQTHAIQLQNLFQKTGFICSSLIRKEQDQLKQVRKDLTLHSRNLLTKESKNLQHLDSLLNLLSFEATLNRGFSMTSIDGKILTNAHDASPGTTIETYLKSGVLKSRVEKKPAQS